MSITPEQYAWLVRGIDPQRVQRANGHSHLEAWDVRRHLIRIFGFDGFDIETKGLELVREIEHPVQADGQPWANGKPRWTVVYRAEIRLTIKVAGRPVAVFEDAASGDSCNQPSLGDAHDMAMKTALSQGLKRCAVNLGDAFGLGLYNGGRTNAVVLGSVVAPAGVPAVAPPATEDAPVQPEPTLIVAADISPEPAGDTDTPPEPLAAPTVDPLAIRDQALDPDVTREGLRGLFRQARDGGVIDAQMANGTGNARTLRALILGRVAELARQEEHAVPGPGPEPTTTEPSPVPVNGARPAIGPAPPADTRHHRHMHALWRQLGVTERDARLALTTGIISREIATSRDLSAIEAELVIRSLQAELDARGPTQQQRLSLDEINRAVSVAANPAELAAVMQRVEANRGRYSRGDWARIERWHQLATTRVLAATRVGTPVAETAGAR